MQTEGTQRSIQELSRETLARAMKLRNTIDSFLDRGKPTKDTGGGTGSTLQIISDTLLLVVAELKEVEASFQEIVNIIRGQQEEQREPKIITQEEYSKRQA